MPSFGRRRPPCSSSEGPTDASARNEATTSLKKSLTTPLPERSSADGRLSSPASSEASGQAGRASGSSTSSRQLFRPFRRIEVHRQIEQGQHAFKIAGTEDHSLAIDFHRLDYISHYDTNLTCAICHSPFVDPIALDQCNHCFCDDCIHQKWISGSDHDNQTGRRGSCPACGTIGRIAPLSATQPLRNLVQNLVVKCPQSDKGCQVEIKRCDVLEHVRIYCGYALVTCREMTCQRPVQRKDVEQSCLHSLATCWECQLELEQWQLEMHWRTQCSGRKVRCRFCDEVVPIRELESHDKCSCRPTRPSCPGKMYGCSSRSLGGPNAESHAKKCVFARLAPLIERQQWQLDEQQSTQRQILSRLGELAADLKAMREKTTAPGQPQRAGSPTRPDWDANSCPLSRERRWPSMSSTTTSSECSQPWPQRVIRGVIQTPLLISTEPVERTATSPQAEHGP